MQVLFLAFFQIPTYNIFRFTDLALKILELLLIKAFILDRIKVTKEKK